MKPLALGVFEDLRRRRLLPVAILLLIALVAVPVLMLKKADPVPVTTSVPAAASGTADGLPSPKEALAGDKPLVSLAVLKQSSDLDSFASKNPFKPMEKVSTGGAESASATAPAGPVNGSNPTGAAPIGAGSPSGGSLPGPVGGGSPGGGGGPGAGSPGAGAPTPVSPPTDSPPATPKQAEPPRRFTYAVDLTFRSPRGRRRVLAAPRLTMLPSQAAPLLVFLGVDDTGGKAVFLVDFTLRDVGGEGSCKPSPEQCATVSLEPGEVEVFTDEKGGATRSRSIRSERPR